MNARQKAKNLKKKIDILKSDNDLMRRIISELKEQTKWIPVDENLPEEGVDVLVCDKYGEMRITNGKYYTFNENWTPWCWDIDDFAFGKVVAWKPLPEPY